MIHFIRRFYQYDSSVMLLQGFAKPALELEYKKGDYIQ